jgi:hypothetical protein
MQGELVAGISRLQIQKLEFVPATKSLLQGAVSYYPMPKRENNPLTLLLVGRRTILYCMRCSQTKNTIYL